MKNNTWFIAARILLGLMFVVFGFNGFVPFVPFPPSIPQNAMTFFGVMVQSHFSYFVFGVQLLSGLLLLDKPLRAAGNCRVGCGDRKRHRVSRHHVAGIARPHAARGYDPVVRRGVERA